MTAAPVTVRVGFDLSAIGSPTLFTLNDPVQGVLSPHAAAVAADSPVGWWRLNDASGGAFNQTGSVNGVYVGSPTRLAGPLSSDGDSVGLNGITQYVTIAAQSNINSVTTDNLSVEAWFVCDDVSPITPQVVWEEGGTSNGISLYVYAGELYGLMWTSSVIRKQISVPISSNTVYHAVFVSTVAGTRCELYLNGVSVGTPVVNTATPLPAHTDPNGVGSNAAGSRSHISSIGVTGSWSFAGRIGDVARYNVGLSATQVLNHYEASVNATVLGGTLYQDVTPFVRNVTVRRGRSRRLDRYQTGTAAVTFNNSDRRFDPVYALSPYAGQIKPRRPITIEVGSEYLFTGLVEDWNLDYALGGDSTATALCVDGFVLLAGAELDSFTNVVELPGERVQAILDRPEVSWPIGARHIADGSQLLQADTVDDATGVLSYLQLVEETENGALFVAADGVLTFKGANTPASEISDLVFTNVDEGAGLVAYDDMISYDANVPYAGGSITGTFVGYSGIAVEYGTETLFNRVIVTRLNSGTVATADNLDSQAEFGVTALDQQGLLFSSDDQLAPIAEYLVNRYGTPQVRIRSITVNAHALESGLRSRVLGLDFGDVIRVRFTPNGIGDPIDQFLTVEGVEHGVTSFTHQVTFDMETITYFPFELDSGDYGILNTNVLGL